MRRFITTCFLVVMLMPLVAARADNVSEQRDIVSKKAVFLRSQKDYIERQAASAKGRWGRFSEAVDSYLRMYDEMTDDKEAADLSEGQLSKLMQQIEHLNGLIPMQLPAGTDGQTDFGAYYTKLDYYPEWDKPWRVGPDADVIVRFGEDSPRFIFWRGTNYIPHWVTDNGIWYNNEFNETWPTRGCSEPMSDKQCRYARVRIIESHPARVVVHWRYALCDVDYKIAWPNEQTGWGDWTDEYYTLYPDAIGTRTVTLHTSHFGDDEHGITTDDLGHEWHEGIIVYNAFVMPEEALHVDAVHVANMHGKSAAWSWQEPGEPTTPMPDESNIVLMNVRSPLKPFVVAAEGCEMDAYGGCQNGSRFRWRDHWPTTMEDVVGRDASGRKASHGSFFHITDIPVYERDGGRITKVLLHGMTERDIGEVVPVAKSWLKAPAIQRVEGCESQGYDLTQRAYVLECEDGVSDIELQISASEDSPLVNPAFVIKNWGENDIELKLNGKTLKCGEDYRRGHRYRLEGTDLILWMPYESERTTEVVVSNID